MATESFDPKPSGAAFQAPLDLSYEAGLVFSKLIAGVYAGLHPVNILLAGVALCLVGVVSSWLQAATEVSAESVTSIARTELTATWERPPLVVGLSGASANPLAIATELMQPWSELAWSELVRGSFWRQAVLCLWGVVVWSWAGTMICRSSALRLGRVDHQWWDVVRFTNQHFLDSLFSILIPLVAVAALAAPLVAVGWLLVWDWTSIVGAPLAVVGSVFGLLMGIVLLGVVLAWPLMFPAIAFEGRDSFESISRSYAYILQRPVHAFLVAVAAIAIGSITGFVIELFCALSAGGYSWALSWGANAWDSQRLGELLQTPAAEGSWMLRYWSTPLLRTSDAGFAFLGRAAGYAMFWGLASGAYLLLRRYLDQTPLDEIYRPGQGTLKALDT